MEANGTTVDPSLHNDLVAIMESKSQEVKEQYPTGTFKNLFWEQQLKAAKAKGPNGCRWHPMIIRWCLNLKMISSAAYHAMRSAGFVTLPSERTLRDYSNFFQSKPGFQHDVNKQLMREAKVEELDDLQRHVVLIFDEMKIIVYNKNSGEVIGFVNMGDVNNQLSELERTCRSHEPERPKIAKQMLTFMVRGIFAHLQFPYAHFPTAAITSDYLSSLVWEAIRQLELCGFKVIAVTCDGASTNRKFFRMHVSLDAVDGCSQLTYKARNPYSKEARWVFFISDVPHLLKTTRNCWSHSFGHGRRRQLWVCCLCFMDLHVPIKLCVLL